MTLTSLPIHILKPGDLHQRRWMMFLGGENFTARGQAVAKDASVPLQPGRYWKRDVFFVGTYVPSRVLVDELA